MHKDKNYFYITFSNFNSFIFKEFSELQNFLFKLSNKLGICVLVNNCLTTYLLSSISVPENDINVILRGFESFITFKSLNIFLNVACDFRLFRARPKLFMTLKQLRQILFKIFWCHVILMR